MIKVIIRGRNCENYLDECLNSLVSQTYSKWQAYIILDDPEDNSITIAGKYVNKDNRFNLMVNHTRVGVAANIWNGVSFAHPDSKDIIGFLDADDRLRKKALETVVNKYKKHPNALITHGSFWRMDKKRRTKTSKPYKKGILVRMQPWRASHLKTFKGCMWKHFKKEWLQNDKGDWLQAASDLALMFPLIEMAGLHRVEFIKKVLYEWRLTPQKTRGHLQKRAKDMLRKRKPVKRIKSL